MYAAYNVSYLMSACINRKLNKQHLRL